MTSGTEIKFTNDCITFSQHFKGLEIEQPYNLNFHGCYCKLLKRYYDGRGWLTEIVKEHASLQMAYYSHTHPVQARDTDRWHRHRLQTDRFLILDGGCVFGLSDGKETTRVAMSCKEPYMLFIPAFIYHCFMAGADGVMLLNHPTALFNPDDELRIPFVELEAPAPWNPKSES